MSSSNSEPRDRTGQDPAGPSWPKTTSPCQSRRINPAKSSIWAVVIRGMPYTSWRGAMPRPIPRVNRPSVRRCIVVA